MKCVFLPMGPSSEWQDNITILIIFFYEKRQTWIRTISEECTKKNDVPKSAQKKPKRITSSDDHFFVVVVFFDKCP